jgi:hypothetical protein
MHLYKLELCLAKRLHELMHSERTEYSYCAASTDTAGKSLNGMQTTVVRIRSSHGTL